MTAAAFGELAQRSGVPPGVLNIVHGFGKEVGAALVENDDVDLISFTGSCETGRWIQRVASDRLAKVGLELGGKNPFVVCDDADLDAAARWATLSAFSNAGQRCASGSRLIVMETVLDAFRKKLVDGTHSLKVGATDDCDLGPVITERQLAGMIAAVEQARTEGASILVGGARLTGPEHQGGSYMAPTVIEGARPDAAVSRRELFGPITCLYPARNFEHALALANDTAFGLTAAIHTSSVHRVERFTRRARAGMIVVNGGTYGNEPHMPFGGFGASGNGWRDTGTEALDLYSEWKTIYTNHDPEAV